MPDLSVGLSGDDGCADSAKLVYTVDEDNTFSSFDPSTLTFTDLGKLSCPDIGNDTPFSMAVDRSAIAWVLFSPSGRIYKVDINNGAACNASSFTPSQLGFEEFGMGFASNAVDSNDETLFIAGGSPQDISAASSQFGSVAFPSLMVSRVGSVDGWPELTGTGDAKLWGFYPDSTPPNVSAIDKSSGAASTTFPLPSLAGTPEAWAFAFWGGDFWIFLQRDVDSSTTVYHLKSADGTISAVKPDTNRKIVGAGVSTCAPVTIS